MTTPFPPSSRYHHVPVLTRTLPDGTVVAYLGPPHPPGQSSGTCRWRCADSTAPSAPTPSPPTPTATPRCGGGSSTRAARQDPADLTGTEGRLVLIPLPLEIADDGHA